MNPLPTMPMPTASIGHLRQGQSPENLGEKTWLQDRRTQTIRVRPPASQARPQGTPTDSGDRGGGASIPDKPGPPPVQVAQDGSVRGGSMVGENGGMQAVEGE